MKRNLLSFLIILNMSLCPLLVLAQTETEVISDQAPVESSISVETIETVIPSPEEVTPSLAPTDSVQETIPAELLEGSVNPQQENALEEAIQIIDEATIELEAEIVIAATSTERVIELVSMEEEEVIETLEQATTTEVAQLDMEILTPKKEFTFALEGGAIATKENPEWTQSPEEKSVENASENVTDVPVLDVDTHSLLISGSCVEPYFVILIYRHPDDYDQNPSSYIFNRAYPCIGGQYSYSLSELPFNLESDTFYLLVGGQGSTGSWKPISALVPVGITVTTTYVNASGTPVDINNLQ